MLSRTFKKFRLYLLMLLAIVQLACAQAQEPEVQAQAQQTRTQCADPVIMLVLGKLSSVDALKEYGAALKKLNTYAEQQGYYFTANSPTEVFEGVWPDNQFVVTAKFPCVEAARGFWFSDDYQSIRHLRSGAGDISVSIFPINAAPDRINGAEPKRLFEQRPTQKSP